MAPAEQQRDGDLWFSTELDAAKVEEIERDPRVNVTFQGDGLFLSLSGQAQVVRDRAKFKALWNPFWNIWFDGEDDPNGGLIRIDATEGEYWDNSGTNRFKFLFNAAKALVTGDEQDSDDQDSDQHGKLSL